jgi:hypothetical protein
MLSSSASAAPTAGVGNDGASLPGVAALVRHANAVRERLHRDAAAARRAAALPFGQFLSASGSPTSASATPSTSSASFASTFTHGFVPAATVLGDSAHRIESPSAGSAVFNVSAAAAAEFRGRSQSHLDYDFLESASSFSSSSAQLAASSPSPFRSLPRPSASGSAPRSLSPFHSVSPHSDSGTGTGSGSGSDIDSSVSLSPAAHRRTNDERAFELGQLRCDADEVGPLSPAARTQLALVWDAHIFSRVHHL